VDETRINWRNFDASAVGDPPCPDICANGYRPFYSSLSALSPFLIEHFRLSYVALGAVVGLYLLPGAFVALPAGIIAKRFGDKQVSCIGLVAMTAGGSTSWMLIPMIPFGPGSRR
jgi:MFS family permease